MSTVNGKKLKESVEILKLNPLFNMSLGSKELFHSNFLAWLLSLDQSFTKKFFKELGFKIEKSEIVNPPKREKDHIDLIFTVTVKNKIITKRFIFENKVKSSPDASQLIGYHEKCEEIRTIGQKNTYLILSIQKPVFKIKSWKYISYRKLADAIIAANGNSKSLGKLGHISISTLIKSYCEFICSLDQIMHHWDKRNDLSFCDRISLREEIELLDSIRIRDLMEKSRFSELMINIKERYKDLFKNDVFNSGYSQNGGAHGLMGFKHVVLDGFKFGKFLIGVQLQGTQLRLFIESLASTKNENINLSEKVYESLLIISERLSAKKLWITIPPGFEKHKFIYPDGGPQPNQLGPSFRFRYVNLDTKTSFEEIIQIFKELKEHIDINQNKILRIFKSVSEERKLPKVDLKKEKE